MKEFLNGLVVLTMLPLAVVLFVAFAPITLPVYLFFYAIYVIKEFGS
jgi:hypothetical protein